MLNLEELEEFGSFLELICFFLEEVRKVNLIYKKKKVPLNLLRMPKTPERSKKSRKESEIMEQQSQ